MLGQLGAERRLDHPPGQLRDEATGPRDLVGLKALQGVLERLSGQQTSEPVDDLLGWASGRRIGASTAAAGLRLLRGHRGSFPARRRVGPDARPSRGSRRTRPGASSQVDHPDLTQKVGQNRRQRTRWPTSASRPKPAKLATNLALRAIVQDDLKRRYSPDQIAGRLRRRFPENPEMLVSTETIYQSLYVQSGGRCAAT